MSTREALETLLLDVDEGLVSDLARRQLCEYVEMLVLWRRSMNLTGYRDASDIMTVLVAGALALWQAIRSLDQSTPIESLVDLGSGAGLPGIPISIIEPELSVLLVESRGRRHHFQKAVRRELSLANLSSLQGRMEELPASPSDVAVAQAVAPASQVTRWGAPWVRPGGLLCIPGGARAKGPASNPDFPETGVLQYQAPVSNRQRSLWWGRRGI